MLHNIVLPIAILTLSKLYVQCDLNPNKHCRKHEFFYFFVVKQKVNSIPIIMHILIH